MAGCGVHILPQHAPGNPDRRQRRGQSRNCCCCPCAAQAMRWRGPLPAQSNYHTGILAAKHALARPANPRVALACQRLPLWKDSSPSAAAEIEADGESLDGGDSSCGECLVATRPARSSGRAVATSHPRFMRPAWKHPLTALHPMAASGSENCVCTYACRCQQCDATRRTFCSS